MKLVFLGPPGAGKGTQCQILVRKHAIVHLSTGDMLRAAVAAGTPVGMKVRDVMARGELVTDELVISIIADEIRRPQSRRGFVLDGFPRTIAQAEALAQLLERETTGLDAVIELQVNDKFLMHRIESRIQQMRSRGELARADDNPEVMQRRLVAYHVQVTPLSAYYRSREMLVTIDGLQSVDEVAANIEGHLLKRCPAEMSRSP